MMATDGEQISPEEKLLRAVEQGAPSRGLPPGAPAAAEPGPPAAARFARLIRGWFDLKLHELRERGLLPAFKRRRFDLAAANRFLVFLIAFLFVSISVDWFFFKPKRLLWIDKAGSPAKDLPAASRPQEPVPLDYYTSFARKRNLFQPYVPPPPPPPPQRALTALPQPSAGPPNLRVVAIAATGDGFEAIIEDTGQKQTYFVAQGGRFKEYEVESIDWKTVVIRQGNERWELHP